MSQHDRDREDRAFEALIVSQLRRQRDCRDINDLLELNESEKAAMKALPDDLIERLWEQEETADQQTLEVQDDEYELIDEELYVGMNRADGPTDETQKKLDEARREVLDQLRKKPMEGSDAKP
jgi:hypothetical protein